MSNVFTSTTLLPFMGATYRLPVKLPQGIAVPANQVPPSVCPLFIDWNVYWQLLEEPANLGVSVNLQASSVMASILDRIASVKIDNTGSGCSVYVQFPDTGDVINCPPNCSVTFPCLTNLLSANIYAIGLTAGFIPQTRVFFYNSVLPPAVDYEVSQSLALYKASPTITRGTTILNENYGVPALGDQFFASAGLNITLAGSEVPLWNTPYESGFLYVTDFSAAVLGATASPAIGAFTIESTGAAGVLANIQLNESNGQIFRVQGNIKLDATQQWRAHVQTPLTSGVVQLYGSFTQSPI